MVNFFKKPSQKITAVIVGLGLAVSIIFTSGIERAQASTVTCGTAVAATLSVNLGCEVSTSATQDKLSTTPITVNAEDFFGTVDWSYLGKKNVDGVSEGTTPPTLTGTNTAQSGTLGIVASLWSTYGQIMAIFKDGNSTFITGFLLNTNGTSFAYVSPFLQAGQTSKDISHVTLYGRGTPGGGTGGPSPVPLPAGLPLMLTALGGLVAVVRRKSRKVV